MLTELFYISLTWAIVFVAVILVIVIAVYSYYNKENILSYDLDKYRKQIEELEEQLKKGDKSEQDLHKN